MSGLLTSTRTPLLSSIRYPLFGRKFSEPATELYAPTTLSIVDDPAGRKLTWTNNSIGHLGTHIYRAPTLDPQDLPAPVATVDPVAQGATAEWIDTEELAPGDYEYAVRDYDGSGEGALSAVVTHTVEQPSLDTAQIGDEIGGGIYAGTHTNGTETWHVIFAKQAGESGNLRWGNYGTVTGATDPDDGLANQNLILSSFDDGQARAFYHCRDYVDAEGNNDYYLPARNELALVDALADMSHAEFQISPVVYRWASTEETSGRAWGRRLTDGKEFSTTKYSDTRRARPVRRVAVPPPDYSTAQIGDEIGGGIYAGIDTIGGTDYHIVAGLASSEEYGLQWKTSRTTTSGAISDTDGLANTQAMEAAGIADHPAAQHCLAYAGGGHTDWHMPARSQLTLIYNNLAGHAEFAANVSSGGYTWSSTGAAAWHAWNRRFSDGDEYNSYKDHTNRRVRPVRRVAVEPTPLTRPVILSVTEI